MVVAFVMVLGYFGWEKTGDFIHVKVTMKKGWLVVFYGLFNSKSYIYIYIFKK